MASLHAIHRLMREVLFTWLPEVLTPVHTAISVMAGQLYWAALNGRLDDVRRRLDQGVHPDEFYVSTAPAVAGAAFADALCWVPHWRAARVHGADDGSLPRLHGHCAAAAGPRR